MNDSRFVVPERLKAGYRRFIDSCVGDQVSEFRLTPRSDASPYALCFAIYGLKLLGDESKLALNRDRWHEALRSGLDRARAQRLAVGALGRDKPYLQLLTFTLSALAALGTVERDPLADHVLPLLPHDISLELASAGVFEGVARSGNHAMFVGVLLIHACRYLGRRSDGDLLRWVELHRQHMNHLGFWGPARTMSHLQFQNGYHQYELFDYLGVDLSEWRVAATNVASLADSEGHFAPYPGGGGCYDYDAVFLLTGKPVNAASHEFLLNRLAKTIVDEQNPDGGFGESQRIRPRSARNLVRGIQHILSGRGRARLERSRQFLSLLRPAHDRIHTHWSAYSREWGESDLWDSWFRVMALARIEIFADHSRASQWGFIDYPGIGFHHCLRHGRE